jgi:hypothetical protein
MISDKLWLQACGNSGSRMAERTSEAPALQENINSEMRSQYSCLELQACRASLSIAALDTQTEKSQKWFVQVLTGGKAET